MYKLVPSIAGASSTNLTFFASQELNTIDKYTPISFLEGLIFGAIGTQVQNLADCGADSVFEIKDAEKILTDIENHKGVDAVNDFVQMLQVIPAIYEKCPLIMRDKDIYNEGVITWIK